MHLLVTDWVTIIVLHWLDDINKMNLGTTPVMIMLFMLMMSFWYIVMFRDPVVIRFMLFFWCLSHWILPVVLIKVMIWLFFITVLWDMVLKIFKHLVMSMLFMWMSSFNVFMDCHWIEMQLAAVIFVRIMIATMSIF